MQRNRRSHLVLVAATAILGALPLVAGAAVVPKSSVADPGAVPSSVAEALPRSHRYLVVGGFGSPLISSVRVTRAGEMSLVPGSPWPTGPAPLGFAITPDARMLYQSVTGGGVVLGYRIGADGALTPVPEATVVVGSSPVGAAITPDGSRLFISTGPVGAAPGTIQSFAISRSGALTPTGAAPAPLDSPVSQLAITPDARHIVASNYLTNTVVSFAIGRGSTLTQVGAPLPTGDKPVMPELVPSGRFVYITDEGGGTVSGFSISRSGVLRPTPGSPYPAGGLPHAAVATRDSKRLYAADAEGVGILGWEIQSGGRLVPLPGAPYAAPGLQGRVLLSPDNRRLFAVQAIARDGEPVFSRIYGYVLDREGRPVPDGRPPLNTQVVFHDGSNAYFTPNQGPSAVVEQAAIDRRTVTLSAARSRDTDGRVVRYRWWFGDGTQVTTSTPSVTHRYQRPGRWTVRLEVVDDEGCSTRLVYGGATVSCRGGSAARAQLEVSTS